MKLTYTIEVEMVREAGPNLTKAQVSAEVLDTLTDVQHAFGEGFSMDRLGDDAFEARWHPTRWDVREAG